MATLRNYISKMPVCHIIKGIPMEQDCVFADLAQIDLHHATLGAVITGKPDALVINVDETEHQTWADSLSAQPRFLAKPYPFRSTEAKKGYSFLPRSSPKGKS
jgi:hypothetical protein